jgi:carboxyl-terminal processing protease
MVKVDFQMRQRGYLLARELSKPNLIDKENCSSKIRKKMLSMQKRERLIWISITAVLTLFLILLSFVPAVHSRNDKYYIDLFTDVLQYVKSTYVDEEKADTGNLIEGALKGMLEALEDPNSAYLTAEEMKMLEEATTLRYGGVGMRISETDKGIEVSRSFPGAPAYKAGILAGDVIVAVDGKPIEELNIDTVLQLIRGDPGTEVTLSILRTDTAEWETSLTRELIEIPSVREAIIPEGIGYIQIISFGSLTYQRVQDALETLKNSDYKALIVDLRGNPGGLLNSVVKISDLFFDKGTVIVSTRSRTFSLNRTYKAQGDAVVPDEIPIVILIDKYSASASEIFTGALKDYGRAVVMGEVSYGKGTVQEIQPKGDGGIKLTTSYYLTPKGTNINEVGIQPDIEVLEEEFTDKERESYRKLIGSFRIEHFVDANRQPSEDDIQRLLQDLKKEGIELRESRIRKYIQDEVDRLANVQKVYDLEYDVVLREAVRVAKEQAGF